jgi:HAD superfamily 5'-nucleotidase-like hydrolase
MAKKVYVNRTLNLRKIKYLGFDMDHTLVRYHSRAFEAAAHKIMLDKLMKNRAYPKQIAKLPFNYDFAVRGLVLDKRKGNILKLSRHGAIRVSTHGTATIDYELQRETYGTKYIDLRESNYSSVDTAFSISTAVLFAQLVDFKDAHPALGLPDYATIASDILSTIDEAHRDGSLKDTVRNDLAKFIVKDEKLVKGLERFRQHGKKLFLLTNSDFHYTKLLLDFAVNPFLTQCKDWSELFDIVITGAQKPRFFYDNLKFLRVNPQDGTMTNQVDPISPGIYQGGSANIFTKDLELDEEDILYIGDHIYGDIVRLKKDCNWRTAMVIEDLADEIDKYKQAKPVQEKIDGLMAQKIPLEEELVQLNTEKIELGKKINEARLTKIQKDLNTLDKKISELIRKQHEIFNHTWGEIMRAGNDESYFAYQVERYACIYMAYLSDLLSISPRTYFRAYRRPMPHEIEYGI